MRNSELIENSINPSAKIISSTYGCGLTAYRNAEIVNCNLGNMITIGDDSVLQRSTIDDNVAINRRNYINDSKIGCYSYTSANTIINFANIGRFCSIARNVDIGGFDHDYNKVTTMPLFRFAQMNMGGNELAIKPDYEELCHIGNDVWIAAGAHILHNVNLGNGAVIGAGAVVTKDVEPYAIVAGIPAKLVKYRFSDKYIEELESIQWWNWPVSVIIENIQFLLHTNVNDDAIEVLKGISSGLSV